jgi:sigma-E factor negative regulatory protein RseC
MIETDAVVVAVEGGRARVEADRRSSCGHCDASGSCGGSLLSELFGNRPVQVEADNAIGAAVGDRVVLGLPERVMMTGSLMLYLVPLLGLFAGALLGEYFAVRLAAESTEPWAVLGGLLGLTALPALMRRTFQVSRQQQVHAVILRRLPSGMAVEPPVIAHEKEK